MVIIGFYLMFYGRSTIDITVFLAATFIALALLGSILTLFVSPNSSTIVIYTSFLLLLFLSCMLGYAATKLITVSIFFIGACTNLLKFSFRIHYWYIGELYFCRLIQYPIAMATNIVRVIVQHTSRTIDIQIQ